MARRRRLVLAVGAASLLALLVVPAVRWYGAPDWRLEGFAMTLCPCDTPCPCRSGGSPTHGGCLAATFVDVVHGHYGDLPLDGLRFVTIGEMRGGSERVVYYPENTPPAARAALVAIARRMLTPPGWSAPWLALLVPAPEVLRPVSELTYVADGGDRQVTIPGVITLHARLRADADGAPREKVAALDELSNWIAYADNLVYRYEGPDLPAVDFSGRQADFKTFDVRRRDYDEGHMLFQNALSYAGSVAILRSRLEEIRASAALDRRPLEH